MLATARLPLPMLVPGWWQYPLDQLPSGETHWVARDALHSVAKTTPKSVRQAASHQLQTLLRPHVRSRRARSLVVVVVGFLVPTLLLYVHCQCRMLDDCGYHRKATEERCARRSGRAPQWWSLSPLKSDHEVRMAFHSWKRTFPSRNRPNPMQIAQATTAAVADQLKTTGIGLVVAVQIHAAWGPWSRVLALEPSASPPPDAHSKSPARYPLAQALKLALATDDGRNT